MSVKNFAALTIADYHKLKLQNVDVQALFKAYAQQNAEAMKKLNIWIDFYDYTTHKLPVSIKGNMFIKNKRVTAASAVLTKFVAPFDSTVYELLVHNNCDVIGHTNMDELAMGSHGTYSYYGAALNPNDPEKAKFDINSVFNMANTKVLSPGGSSSGMSVSVATGLCLAALGSDTGGSVRVPAEYCGLCGFKPTFGNISRYGVMELSSTLDTVGIVAKTAKCLKYIANILMQEDTKDSVNQLILLPYTKKRKIATLNNISKSIVTPAAQAAYELAQIELRNLGYIVEEVEINADLIKMVDLLYSIICYTDAKSSMGVFSSVPYNADIGNTGDISERLSKTIRSSGLGWEIKRRSVIGEILAGPDYAHYVDKVRYVIQDLTIRIQNILKEYDAILTPVSGGPAYIHDPYATIGRKGALTSDVWLCIANLCTMPAGVVPISHDNTGFHAVQIIGDIGHDLLVLDVMDDLDTKFNFNEKYRGKFEYINDGIIKFMESN